jgi:alcohol dehydrogenase
MDRVIAYELEVYGSHGMAAADYPAMLDEIAAAGLEPGALVSGRLDLDDLVDALPAMGDHPPTGTHVVTF